MRTEIRYRIQNAQVEVISHGPFVGIVMAEVKLLPVSGRRNRPAGEAFYLSLSEIDGYPGMYRTDYSIFEQRPSEVKDPSFWRNLNDDAIFDETDYWDILQQENDALYEAYRYLIWLIRCDAGEDQDFIEETEDECIGDFDIPMSDVEEEFRMDAISA